MVPLVFSIVASLRMLFAIRVHIDVGHPQVVDLLLRLVSHRTSNRWYCDDFDFTDVFVSFFVIISFRMGSVLTMSSIPSFAKISILTIDHKLDVAFIVHSSSVGFRHVSPGSDMDSVVPGVLSIDSVVVPRSLFLRVI